MNLQLANKTFSVTTEQDLDWKPWDMDDYMPMSDWSQRDKKPGEIIVSSDYPHKRFFDFAGCVAQYRKDGVKGADAAKYAQENCERVRQWCNDQWYYVGVVVTDTESEESESLWGIESDCGIAYIKETALDLARELMGPNLEIPGLESEPVWSDE
jgi:hypothetical protein